jgi:hypothetical protein
MPTPPSPLDKFLDNLRNNLEKSAEDLLKDLHKEARKNLLDMGKAIRGATQASQRPLRPLPKAQKRARGARGAQRPADPRAQVVTPPQSTLYDVLECSPRASQETLSAAFRSLSSRFHPDNKKTGNAEVYKDITAAWSVLKDPGKRKRYDRENGLL